MRIQERLNGIVLYLSAWLVALVCVVSEQLADPDLWGRLSIAALTFQNGGQFPYHDVFSYTAPNAKWVDHEWLSGFVFYGLFTKLGEGGFLVFKYLMILATMSALFWLHRKVYRASALYAGYGLMALIPFYTFGYYATLRSQVFTFLGFTVFLALLEAVRLGKLRFRALLWLSPLTVFWANCHGGFIVGLLLIGLYGVGEALTHKNWRPLLHYGGLALAAAVLTALINPYGPDYWRFLLHAWTLQRPYIVEWNAMDVTQTTFAGVQTLIATVMVGLLARRWVALRRSESWQPFITPTVVLLFLLVMALKAVRMQTFLAFGVLAYLPLLASPAFLTSILPSPILTFWQNSQRMLLEGLPRLILTGALIGLAFLHQHRLVFSVPMGDELTQGSTWGHYPVGAIRYLQNSPYSGNLFIRFGLGEFAYWCLFPRFKVSMDGRYEEVYSQQNFLENYWALQKDRFLHSDQAFRLIDESAADFVLMNDKLPVLPLLIRSPHWELLYQDPWFLVFGRKTSLKKFPAYNPRPAYTVEQLTIKDFLTPADRARFRFN